MVWGGNYDMRLEMQGKEMQGKEMRTVISEPQNAFGSLKGDATSGKKAMERSI